MINVKVISNNLVSRLKQYIFLLVGGSVVSTLPDEALA